MNADRSFMLCHIVNPLNAELNPICHLLALVGAHHILRVSRVRVNVVSVEISKPEPLEVQSE
jgi:hypothetical protein